MNNRKKLIISLFDYSEEWVKYYIKNGYAVMCWDKKIEGDILEGFSYLLMQIEASGLSVYGIICAPPCTDFASSGARWMKEKDKPNKGFEPFKSTTELSIALVHIALHLVDIFKDSLKFWVLENPIGRIARLVPEVGKAKMYFDPCDFGEPYTKRTVLYGDFNTDLVRTPVKPRFGSMMHTKYGSKSERTKELRSVTPPGFAKAFFNANR